MGEERRGLLRKFSDMLGTYLDNWPDGALLRQQTAPRDVANGFPRFFKKTNKSNSFSDEITSQIANIATAPRVVSKLYRAEAEARAYVIESMPLSIFELLKLRSFDPLVRRANTLSLRTSGKHFLILADRAMSHIDSQRLDGIARALLLRHHRVTYVYGFRSREPAGPKPRLAHQNLTHVRFRNFSARSFALERGAKEEIIVLCELPVPEYLLCARYLKERGAKIIYDCSKDWNLLTNLRWYSPRVEESLLKDANFVTVSDPALQTKLRARAAQQVILLPGALSAEQPENGGRHQASSCVNSVWTERVRQLEQLVL